MARQPRTSKRSYTRLAAERKKIKCPVCGNESSKITLAKVQGVMKWVCTLCATRQKKRNGG